MPWICKKHEQPGLLEFVHLMSPRLGHSTENKQGEGEGDNKNFCSYKAPERAINDGCQAGQGVKRQYSLEASGLIIS